MIEPAAAPPWQEPVRGGYFDPALADRSGVEQLRAVLETATTPPISHLTGMQLTEVGLAGASFTMRSTRWLLSPQGVISLGTLAVLADGPLGCAVHSALPAATGYATSELSLRLLRPARPGGTFVARGRLVHAGKSLALSSVQIVDAGGRLLADGSSLCFVRPLRGASAPPPAERPDEPGAPSPDPYERPELGEPVSREAWERLSGLEVLQAVVAGDLPSPPIHYLTGLHATAVARGEATFAMPCHEWLCSPLGTVEGGTIAMLADGALFSAIQTTAPPNTAVAAIDLKVNFLRPVLPDGRELVARGRIRHAGRTICLGEAEVHNADGKVVAVATGSAILLPGRAATLAEADSDADVD